VLFGVAHGMTLHIPEAAQPIDLKGMDPETRFYVMTTQEA
jgi:hypothetical protein